jgi:hypothetical protein
VIIVLTIVVLTGEKEQLLCLRRIRTRRWHPVGADAGSTGVG